MNDKKVWLITGAGLLPPIKEPEAPVLAPFDPDPEGGGG